MGRRVFWDSDLISELWAENLDLKVPGKILAETSENKFGSLPACEFKQLKDKIKWSDLLITHIMHNGINRLS